jgi:hypothetical protein
VIVLRDLLSWEEMHIDDRDQELLNVVESVAGESVKEMAKSLKMYEDISWTRRKGSENGVIYVEGLRLGANGSGAVTRYLRRTRNFLAAMNLYSPGF